MQTTMQTRTAARAGACARPQVSSRTRLVCRAEDKAVTKVRIIPLLLRSLGFAKRPMWPIVITTESDPLQSERPKESLTFPTFASKSTLAYMDGSLPGE